MVPSYYVGVESTGLRLDRPLEGDTMKEQQPDFRAEQYMDPTRGNSNLIFRAIRQVGEQWPDKKTIPAFLYHWVRYRWESGMRGIKPMNQQLMKFGWPVVKVRAVCPECKGTGKTGDKCRACSGNGTNNYDGMTCWRCHGDKNYTEPCGYPCRKGKIENWEFDKVKPMITEEW